jgi:hypothetical protein
MQQLCSELGSKSEAPESGIPTSSYLFDRGRNQPLDRPMAM